jgi:very-short-patch-repair endonuclease
VVKGPTVGVTSAARSCIDLTREAGLEAGVVATDAALHRGLCTTADLERVYAGCRGRAGLPSGRRLFELADGRSESALESISRLALHALQPIPRSQVTVRTPLGQFLARVDFYWHDLGVVGEADGQLKYTDQQLWQEKLRQDRLTEHGLVVVRWGWVEARRPASLQARIQRAFRQAALLRAAGVPITAAIS